MYEDCYQWAFDFMLKFMWQSDEADPSRYQLCVGIVGDSRNGNFQDHAWIEDTTTGEVLNKYKSKRKIERTPRGDYYGLMHPRYIKRYSGREMLKKVLKSGVHGLMGKIPSKILKAPNFKASVLQYGAEGPL